jgi:hypothetical protein
MSIKRLGSGGLKRNATLGNILPSATLCVPKIRFGNIGDEGCSAPANDRLRPDNRNRAKDGGEPVIKPNKQKTIGIVEVRSFRCPPAKNVDLLP